MPRSARSAHPAGLCSTCSNDPLCSYPRSAGSRVVECLEFEGETKKEAARVSRPPREEEPREGEPGLCSWCENRPTCVFPKPAGGVWFCEEFL
jgi:hypothetical protein